MKFSTDRIHLLLLNLYAVSLPFNEPYSKVTTVIMLLIVGNWVFHRRLSLKDMSLLLMLSFYFLHVVGLIHTDNWAQGVFELDKKIGFLILPIVLSGWKLASKDLHKILSSFVGAMLVASLVCIANAAYLWMTTGRTEVFYYHTLTDIIDMHAIYMAMYVCFAIFIIIYQYRQIILKGTRKNKVLIVLVLTYLIVFLFLLSARTVTLGASIIVFCGLLWWGHRNKKLLTATIVILLLFLGFSALIFFNDTNRERFKEAINYNSEYGIDKQYGGRSTRELIWNCAAQVIRRNPIVGSGTGDAQDVLHECYIANGYHPLTYQPELKYNAHSQYLQTLVDLGTTGLILLLLVLFEPVRKAIRSGEYLFLSFLALFAIACLTESMLELKQGVTFFAFFYTVFVCALQSKKTTVNE